MRLGALLACVLALSSGAPSARAGSSFNEPIDLPAAASGWARAQIAAVVATGAMGPDVEDFRAQDPVTRGELYEALTALGKVVNAPADPTRRMRMRELDAQLVAALGLLPVAKRFRLAARDAGLEPSPMLGTETVARLLGLRINHPAAVDALELLPNELATRAEAAFSLAKLMALDETSLQRVDETSRTFVLPAFSNWQRTVLRRALRFVGWPYVWAGTSERKQERWTAAGTTVLAPGGFDCSGFVWRVYKGEPFPGAPSLGDVLKGRTTYMMSGEVNKAARIGGDALQPGDVVFFGSRGVASKPTDVGHMGIYVGNGWFVHSSSNGVTLQPLQGWYQASFAWARRPLAEVGLV